MTISDTLIILATLVSPLLAVQAQKWIERATSRRHAQLQVFYDLMATRATRVAPKHVEALNRIDMEFSTKRRQERDVIHSWRIYADHLNTNVDHDNETVATQWNIQGNELFADLLAALAEALGYSVDRVQLKRGIYFPVAHGRAEVRREIFEREIVRLLLGETSLNMRVTDFPTTDEAIDLQTKMQTSIIEALKGGKLNIKQEGK